MAQSLVFNYAEERPTVFSHWSKSRIQCMVNKGLKLMRSDEFKNCSKQKDLFMKTFSQEAEKNLYVNKEAP